MQSVVRAKQDDVGTGDGCRGGGSRSQRHARERAPRVRAVRRDDQRRGHSHLVRAPLLQVCVKGLGCEVVMQHKKMARITMAKGVRGTQQAEAVVFGCVAPNSRAR